MTIDLSTLCQWGPEKEVMTPVGAMMLRKAVPSQSFWNVWKEYRDLLKDQGIGVCKISKRNWEVSWWRSLRKTEITAKEDIEIDLPDGLSLLPYAYMTHQQENTK